MASSSWQSREAMSEELESHRAAEADDVVALEALVKNKAVLAHPRTKETPLHAAASKGSLKAIKWLLDRNLCSPLEKAQNGNTAAHFAAVYGHLPALQVLLIHNPAIANQVAEQTDETGLSIASLAALQGDEEMLQWIVEHYPKVATIANQNGNLPIHFAAGLGKVSMVKMLVNKYGKTMAESMDLHNTKPVYFAAQEGRTEVLNYLINELGVDPIAKDKDENSTLHAATQGGKIEAVEFLVSKLGSRYVIDKTIDGATPLHMAAGHGHLAILDYLLKHIDKNEDINILDNIHATPAHDAAENGQTNTIVLLLENGADINITDTENKTPHDLALEQKHTGLANLIVEYQQNGASVLAAYKRNKRKHYGSQSEKLRTVQHEATEVSEAIAHSSGIIEQRKARELQRQESLKRMNKVDENSSKQSKPDAAKEGHFSDEDLDHVEHQLGPMGDIYATPIKYTMKSQQKLKNDSNVLQKKAQSITDTNPTTLSSEAGPLMSLETVSNYSRPSRVKKHIDTESEVSFQSGSSNTQKSYHSESHHAGRQFPLPYPGPYPGFPMAMPYHPIMNQNSGSSIGSKTSFDTTQGYPIPMSYVPYGYYPPPMPMTGLYPGHYPGAVAAPPGYYHPRTTEERMHLAALQRRGHHIPGAHSNVSSRNEAKRRLGTVSQTRIPQPDQDIGYGPTTDPNKKVEQPHIAEGEELDFHPQAPPITNKSGGEETAQDVVNFDNNFIMAKKGGQPPKVGETTLNPAKPAPFVYDGRYDQYIMTDSEEDVEIKEHCRTSALAECAAIIAIGCVVSFKGIEKKRNKKKSAATKLIGGKSSAASTKGSLSEGINTLSPIEYSNQEESRSIDWDSSMNAATKSAIVPSIQTLNLPDTLAESLATLPKQVDHKSISDSLWARNSSMLNITSGSLGGSRAGSRVSLNQTSDEDDDDDLSDDDLVSMLEGVNPSEAKRASKGKKLSQKKTSPSQQKKDAEVLVENSSKPPKEKKSKSTKQRKKRAKKSKQATGEVNEGNANEKLQATQESLEGSLTNKQKDEEVHQPMTEIKNEVQFDEKMKNEIVGSEIIAPVPVPSLDSTLSHFGDKQSKSNDSQYQTLLVQASGDAQQIIKPPKLETPRNSNTNLTTSAALNNRPVEVPNINFDDDDDDDDDDDAKDLHTTSSNGTQKVLTKSQTIDDIIDDLDNIVIEMDNFKDGIQDHNLEDSSTVEDSAKTNAETMVLVPELSKEQRASQSDTANVSKDKSTPIKETQDTSSVDGKAKPTLLEQELLKALHNLQSTVDTMRSNAQSAPYAQQMQHDLIQKMFELNNSPEFIARILTLWSKEEIQKIMADPMKRSASHQLITTGLQQQLQKAREQEYNAPEQAEEIHHHTMKHEIEKLLKKWEVKFARQFQKGRRKRKGKKSQDKDESSNSDDDLDHDHDNSDEEGFVTIKATPGIHKPESKTMHANIHRQNLLTEEIPRPNVIEKKLLRRPTNVDFNNTTNALENLTTIKAVEDDDVEMQVAVAKPATIKKAAIHKQVSLNTMNSTTPSRTNVYMKKTYSAAFQ